MRSRKIFALLLTLCMIASTFVALPVSAATESVIDINAPLDDASELTWIASSAVTVSNADGIGGRDNVVKVEGLANSNSNTAGVKLPDGFAFAEGDVLTYSIDVYSNTEIHPDMWLRDHLDLAPFAQLAQETVAVDTWTTVSGTVTYEELVAKSLTGGSTGAFNIAGNYAFYIRPRETAGIVYLDNLEVKVTRETIEKENVIEIEVNSAADITWKNGGTAADADGIGGRDGVIELASLANSNGNTAGVKLPDGFSFTEDDIFTFSFDAYSDVITNPDIWIRNHDSSLAPYATIYNTITTGEWTSVSRTVTFNEMVSASISDGSTGTFENSGNYAVYFRPRQSGTLYIDNFKVTVTRPVVTTFVAASAEVNGASDITWLASEAVTAADADGIGGRDGVIKLEGLADSNSNSAGVMLAEKFAFREDDVLTYSLDVYSESEVKPNMWLRNHGDESLAPFAQFNLEPLAANTWTTISGKATYEDLVAKSLAGGSTGEFTKSGNYAFYVRPDAAATLYIDNFTVTVERTITGVPTIEKLDYVVYEDEKYIVTTESVVENEAFEASSSTVRIRIIPEQPVSTSGNLKVSFDFKAVGILNSEGNLYETMPVNLRLYDSVDGTLQDNTIGYIKANVPANVGVGVPVEFYIEDMENGGGLSTSTEIASIGIQVDMGGAYTQYEVEENGGYFTITNIKIEDEAKTEHTHTYSEWAYIDADSHHKVCACGDIVTETHTWNAGTVTQEPTESGEGVKTYTCRVCKGTKTEAIDKLISGEKIIDIDLALDDASELSWIASEAVTVSNADGISGRDNVIKVEGLGSGNGTTAGIAIADGFNFLPGDTVVYSIDVYSETAIHPDMWLRNHAGSLAPYVTFYEEELAANTWKTITRTVTYDEMVALSLESNSNGEFQTNGDYKFYIRPRESATVYLDNISFAVLRNLEDVIDIDLPLDAANELTWIASEAVTVTEADGIDGRDGVLKVEGLANSNSNSAGVKLPDGFAFKENDVLTYSVDVYSSVINPDIWLRNHNGSVLTPFATFYHTVEANTWTTLTKTVTYADLIAAGEFNTAGNYALYIRPRTAGTVYLDNFKVTVTRVFTGIPTIEKLDYVTEENGAYTVTTASVVENEAFEASSSTVRIRIIPEKSVSVDDGLKISFDFKADGILNSEGNPYEVMDVNVRLYDSEDGETQSNTIGYIMNANAIANKGEAVPVEFYIEDMVNGGGLSELTDIASIGIQVNMGGAYTQYNTAANDGYYTISNIKLSADKKEDHEHAFIGYKKAGEGENCHAKICACGYAEDEAHIWDEGVVEGTITTYTCICGATYSEDVEIEPTYAPGDANEDNIVDIKDVIAIRRYITGGYGTIVNESAANVNDDTIIDIKDAIAIRRFITGGYGTILK